MKPWRIVRAVLALLLAQAALSPFSAAQAQGVNISPQGGRTTRIDNHNFVLENQVMQVVNGKSTPVNRNVPADALAIGPVCGAFYQGVKQPECGSQPAIFEGAAKGTCPPGTEFDLTRWSCWSCDKSKGFKRGVAAVDSDRACWRDATAQERGAKQEFKPAQKVGTRCPPDSFYDTIGGGTCWSCPAGYNVNALVHAQEWNKCTRPGRDEFSFAELSFRTGDASHCRNRDDGADRGQLVFWDMYNYNGQGAGCWKCPVGFGRTGEPVYSNRACSRGIAADNKPATQRPGGTCEEGTFTHTYKLADPGKQNEHVACLMCPEGYDQVIVEKGDSPRKCQTTTSMVFAPATKESALTCEPGQEFDLIGLTQQDINTRAQFRNQAKPKPVASGTCWSCPEGYYRSVADVKSPGACGSSGVDYYQGIMREPGLFGLDGAAEVLLEVLGQDAALPLGKIGMVEQVMNKWADEQAKIKAGKGEPFNRALAMKEEAGLLVKEPQKSSVAAGLVFARLLTALAEEHKATPAERRLIASFVQYVKLKRTFIAHIAKRQYAIWLETIRWREKNATAKLILDRATMSAYGRPPSFEQAALLATAGVGALDLGVGTALGAIKIPVPLVGEVASVAIGLATGGYQDYTQGLEKALHSTAKTVGEIAFGTTLTAAVDALVTAAIAKSITAGAMSLAAAGAGYSSVAVGSAIAAQTALASTGVGVAIGAVLIVASMQLEQLNQFLDAPAKIGQVVAKATETSKEELIRKGKTAGGMTELLTYWTGAAEGDSQMSGHLAAAYGNVVVRHAYVRNVTAPKLWTQLQGAAVDVGASANGLWVIGTNTVPGGHGLHRWDGKTFVPASGGAVRIDLDPKGHPWVVNNAGQLFRWNAQANKWDGMPGDNAQDIGVGGDGTAWYIGGAKEAGGYGIWRWNASANTWWKAPGSAVRIDVDPKGNAWVVNNANSIFRWNPAANTWDSVPGKARDIGIGPEGSVFVVGDNKTVHRWDGKTWIMRDGQLDEISVGPDGVPVGINASKQIWLGYR